MYLELKVRQVHKIARSLNERQTRNRSEQWTLYVAIFRGQEMENKYEWSTWWGIKKKKRKTLRERWPKATKRKYFMKGDLSLHQILSTCQVRWEPRWEPNHKTRQFEGPSGCWKGLLEWSGLGDNLIGIDFRMTRRRGSRDWLWTNCLKSCVVKERREVKGHLERVMKGKFYKSG